MFCLTVNGETINKEDLDDPSSIVFENDEYGPEWRCPACGESLTEYSDGWADESGERMCAAYDADEHPEHDGPGAPEDGEGPHSSERVALSWANNAAIHTDPGHDEITVMISVGDPRGAFAFTVRRLPDGDHANAGRLVLNTPYPGEPWPHARLTALHPGAFLIG